ncbi:MAG TPA: UPF0182 family protein [Acidimicrobiales bacterium]|nr:UPF0182 family protein [Acidimicrobiales bacterium]
MRAQPDLPRRFSFSGHRARWALVVAAVVLLVLLASAQRLASLYTDYLWFRSVSFSSVWAKTVTIEIGLGACFTVIFFGVLWGNLLLADRLAPPAGGLAPSDELVARWQELASAHMRWIRLVVCVAFALIGGLSAHSQWSNWILFSNAQPFSSTSAPWKGIDPLNHMNDGFYVFRLPFLNWLVGWLFSAVMVTVLLCLVAHYLNGGIRPHSSIQRVSRQVKGHLSVLLAILALIEGGNYYLQRLSLVLSTRYKILDGATYTDVHATRPALVLLIAISVIAAGLFLYNVRQQGWLLPVVAVALWGLVWVLVANIYPAIVQAFVVNPAENVKELPYLGDNITATTSAYDLNNVQTEQFTGDAPVTTGQVTGQTPTAIANRQSIANIPLIQPDLTDVNSIFTKYQGFRNYYTMSGPTTDRYDLPVGPGGAEKETQVLVSARELNDQGVASSWVNQHLQFTHGYGAVVTPSNQGGIASDGSPVFALSGLPPQGQPNLSGPASQPRIYFDDSTNSLGGYVIADSAQPEVDYEDQQTGNEVTNHYTGTGGVPAGGFLRRLAFAVSFGNYNVLISSQVDSSSRVLYDRNVVERVEKAAPFLSYDADPYPVVCNGKIYWVVDAYTTTDNFPYSEQANTSRLAGSADPDLLVNQQFNYIRNSVKAVVDAYNGTVWFFVLDPQDPIIQAYERAYPALFKPMSDADKLVPGITSHWRYPEDMFTVQTNMWDTYHVSQLGPQAASVFYNGSQAWSVADNGASGQVGEAASTTIPATPANTLVPNSGLQNVSPVMPLYELVALPGEQTQKFVLVQPFVPYSTNGDKQNLTAFMTASSDYPEDYGQLTAYTIPPEETVDGPYLVSTRAETNPGVSEIVTLLNRSGSRALLGDVVITPIGQSLLFTVPLYVEQTNNQVPSLDDVIIIYNQQVFQSGTTDPTLYTALCQVTNPGGQRPFASYCSTHAPSPTTTTSRHTPSSTGKHPASTTTTSPPATTTPHAPTTTSTTTARSTTPVARPTTSTTAATGPVQPAPTGTVAQYLATAELDFAYADAALKAGDLGAYQNDIRAAEAAVALAREAAQATTTSRVYQRPGQTKTSTTHAPTSNGSTSTKSSTSGSTATTRAAGTGGGRTTTTSSPTAG